MRDLILDAAERAAHYLETLNDRGVAPTPEAIANLMQLAEPFPDQPTNAHKVLALLDEIGSPATMAMAGSRFFGWVIGGSLPAALGANILAAAWDQNAGLWTASPIAAILEQISLDWMVDLFGLPKGTGGAFVTGATMANFTALAAARHAVLKQAGWDVEANGLFGAPPVTVIVGEEVHPTHYRALGLLGLGRERVIKVPVDGQGRMQVSQFPKISGPTIISVQAGNVNTGAFDPIGDVCEIARATDSPTWVHVDGAFGLWAAATPNYAHLTNSIENADSWATDAHKWLNVPYDSGLTFVREPEHLRGAMYLSAPYLPEDPNKREPSNFTPELSRRARGIEVWAALRSLGRQGIAEMIERTCRHAKRFGDGLRAAGYDILNDVVLNQVIVSFGDAETTRRVIAALQEEGTLWAGPTVWQGHTAMRISVSSWATRDEDVERSLDAIILTADRVRTGEAVQP